MPTIPLSDREEANVDGQETVRVLIPGFGPWSSHSVNPSYEIVKLLPNTFTIELPPLERSEGSGSTLSTGRKININLITLSEPLRVSYPSAAKVVPALLEGIKPDLVLHLGLASNRSYYGVERTAPRDGIRHMDVDDYIWSKGENESLWPKTTFPDTLETGLDYESIVERWTREASEFGDVRATDDVGTYLCGFTYYASLAWYFTQQNSRDGKWRRGGGPVLFLHVPPCETGEQLERGRSITTNLIESMVQSWAGDDPTS